MFAAQNIEFDLASRVDGTAVGGIGAIHLLARRVGLVKEIDERIQVLKAHRPYHESDHVLNMAYNLMCGGTVLEDLELRRNDEVYLKALGTKITPDPTTAGDFCRRMTEQHIEGLMTAINECRLRVWQQQADEFFDEAFIDADGTLLETLGECKEGIGLSYNGVWGYHPLIVSLSNTNEPLFIVNRSGNRPSHEGAAERFDQAIALVRRAGFRRITLRGDTDFSQTQHLDGWDSEGAEFVFGMDAMPNLVRIADGLSGGVWCRLERRQKYEIKTRPRQRPANVKEEIVEQKEYKNIRLKSEDVAEFDYQPTACRNTYRVVVVRKNLSVEKGEAVLFPEERYFFYITNKRTCSAEEIVFQANARCNQENLIAQLRSLRALHSPVDNLLSNWAYMVIASLAWSLKAWFALLLPASGRWKEKYLEEKERVLRMEFRTFLNTFIRIPAQVVRTGRRLVFRVLAWNQALHILLRGVQRLRTVRLC